jgi:YD repeat-containing protein
MKTIAELLKHDFKKGSLYLYDSNGNQIYYEDSDGFWYKQEYDSNGNIIYYENSDGHWEKTEYDSNGNQIYYEDSNGIIRDNRPKQSCDGKIVEIEGKTYKLIELD